MHRQGERLALHRSRSGDDRPAVTEEPSRMRKHPAAGRHSAELRATFGADPFSFLDAVGVVTERSLRTAVSRGEVLRVRRGFYRVVAEADSRGAADDGHYEASVKAALRAHPDCVAVEESAAALHGLFDPRLLRGWADLPVLLRHEGGVRRIRGGEIIRVGYLPERDVRRTSFGLATSPMRTAIDLAAKHGPDRSLVVLDQVFRRQATADCSGSRAGRLECSDPDVVAQLREDAQRCLVASGIRRGVKAVRWAIPRADPAAESPGESLSRARIILAGLPDPVVNPGIQLPMGMVFVDHLWAQFGVVGEVDGRMKYTSPDVLYREKVREDQLRRAGFLVVRWTVDEMLQNPAQVMARIAAALRERGWR